MLRAKRFKKSLLGGLVSGASRQNCQTKKPVEAEKDIEKATMEEPILDTKNELGRVAEDIREVKGDGGMAEEEQRGVGLQETLASLVGLSPISHHLPLDVDEEAMVAST